MLSGARANIDKAYGLLSDFKQSDVTEINEEEAETDYMTDKLSNYLIDLSQGLKEDMHIHILNEYYKVVTQAERLGDHAINICEEACELHENNLSFSKRDIDAANAIEPLEEVVDNIVNLLRDKHLERLREGKCNVVMDKDFLNLLIDIERISDICSNIGIAVVTRSNPAIEIILTNIYQSSTTGRQGL